MDKHVEIIANKYGLISGPIVPQMFGNAGKDYMERYGVLNTFFHCPLLMKWFFKNVY